MGTGAPRQPGERRCTPGGHRGPSRDRGNKYLVPTAGPGLAGGIRSGGTRAAPVPPPHAAAAAHPRARRSAPLGRAQVATVTARSRPAPAINTLLREGKQNPKARAAPTPPPGPGTAPAAAGAGRDGDWAAPRGKGAARAMLAGSGVSCGPGDCRGALPTGSGSGDGGGGTARSPRAGGFPAELMCTGEGRGVQRAPAPANGRTC